MGEMCMTKHCQTGKGMFLKQPFHVLRHMTMDELVDLKKNSVPMLWKLVSRSRAWMDVHFCIR